MKVLEWIEDFTIKIMNSKKTQLISLDYNCSNSIVNIKFCYTIQQVWILISKVFILALIMLIDLNIY